MKEAAAPDPYLAAIDESTVAGLHLLLVVSGTHVRALWHPHPHLEPLLAEIETITGLTQADVLDFSSAPQTMATAAREAVLRPGRLHLFIALGLALRDSPLRESPLVPDQKSEKLSSTDDMVRHIAERLFAWREADGDAEHMDLPRGYAIPDALMWQIVRARATRATETPEPGPTEADLAAAGMPDELLTRTGEELRWARLRLERTIEDAGAELAAAAAADRTVLALDNPAPDEADRDDPDARDYYHDPWFELSVSPLVRVIMGMALMAGEFWYVDATLPFARKASELRWLRRRPAVRALRERLDTLPFVDANDLMEKITVNFSLSELLTMYQAFESLALAGINELLPAFGALHARQRAHARKDGEEPTEIEDEDAPDRADWLGDSLDPTDTFGRFFYQSVSGFAQILELNLTGDYAADLAAARAEVAALAELAVSDGAV